MPIFLAPLAGFIFGVSFAWLSRIELERVDEPVVATRPFNVVLGFALFVYGPLFGYFMVFHGDWTYGYLVAWRKVPSAIDLAIVLLTGASVLFGMAASAHAARSRRLPVVAWLGIVPAVAFAVILAVGAKGLSVSATYAQYRGGFGVQPIASSALGRGVLLMAVILVLGVAWTVRALQQGPQRGDGALDRPRDGLL